jgi:hypothetical protein
MATTPDVLAESVQAARRHMDLASEILCGTFGPSEQHLGPFVDDLRDRLEETREAGQTSRPAGD